MPNHMHVDMAVKIRRCRVNTLVYSVNARYALALFVTSQAKMALQKALLGINRSILMQVTNEFRSQASTRWTYANRIVVEHAKMLLSLVLWLLFPVFSNRSLVLTHAYIVTHSQTFILFQLEQIGSLAAQD